MDRTVTNGFTLLEIVITLAILAIALAIAVPNFSRYIKDYKISSQIDEIASDLQFAKFYAVTHKIQTTVSLNANSYNIYYKNGNSTVSLKNVRLDYPISANSTIIDFDTHGLADNSTSVYINTENNANLNCINIKPIEINIGRWINNACITQ